MNKKRNKIHKDLSSLGRKISGMKILDQDNPELDESRNIKTELVNFDFSKQRINKEALDFWQSFSILLMKFCKLVFELASY